LHPVGLHDGQTVRGFLGKDQFPELARTGVLGPLDEDGQVGITTGQFVRACVTGLLRCFVAVGNDNVPATLVYAAMADPCTVTLGVLNAPGTPAGQGCATAAVALVLDEVLCDPEVHQAVVSAYEWNVASVRILEILGFAVTDPITWMSLPASGDISDQICYVLLREAWMGASMLEAALLDQQA
jgi:hypothetical protein